MRPDFPALAQRIKERGWTRRSSLFQAMLHDFEDFKALIESGEATIAGVGRVLVEAGARNRVGQAPTDRCIRKTWRRVVEHHAQVSTKPARVAAPKPRPEPRPADEAAPGVRLVAAVPPPQAKQPPAEPPASSGGFVLPETKEVPWVAGRKRS